MSPAARSSLDVTVHNENKEFRIYKSGNVKIPNGNLNMTQNNITAQKGGNEMCIGDECA
ncbi:MAG: hypothetical protein ABEJ56_06560 [Candidatus Nanohaloarchaea archaeon]